MRLFGGMKDTMKKSEAAVIVQNLLEIQGKRGLFNGNAGDLANTIVGATWDEKPHLFNGTRAERPHKLSLAAISLAHFCRTHPTDSQRDVLLMSLGMVLEEALHNGRKYGFTQVDSGFFNGAVAILSTFNDQLNSDPEIGA
ncbi:hypothetical protein [Thermomonas sp.]|uniref:hypothetical protein n=1 Tax=Thermomonas sp. TaxID=1971895 RepID=UPI0024897C63|nr:hypothetical protein [Thermomonas sp.]MDI1253848.1 hypothetical protein [Thermomonas sp.]